MRWLLIFISLIQLNGCYLITIKENRVKAQVRKQGLHDHFARLEHDKIHYWHGGKGPPLLLIHGFGANGLWNWEKQVADLAKHYTLIIPDLVWFGESTTASRNYSLEHQVSTVHQLMAYLGYKEYNAAGISYGGLVLLGLMNEWPCSIKKAIIVSSPGPVYEKQDYEALLKRFGVKSIDELVLPTTTAGLDRLLDIAYANKPYIPGPLKKSVLRRMIGASRQEKQELIRYLLEDMDAIRLKNKKLADNTLIIWGSEDPLFPVDIGKRFAAYAGGKEKLKIIKGAHHAPNIEFYKEFNQIVLKFLEK